MSVDERRLHGFRLTKKEVEERRRAEKLRKWNEKLEQSDLVKLKKELDSLHQARFLAPQQNERKRLVERMIRDLERRELKCCSEDGGADEKQVDFPKRERSVSSSSSDDCEGLLVSSHVVRSEANSFPANAHHFLPRALRKRRCEGAVEENNRKHDAKVAEATLLSNNTVGGELEEFFDSL
ncbi:hypothetical protein DQ04_02101050 [Trypanosoma grayi]|uniref:hypothetical protein n=1 Tax=Trypanosoma grayi TaxID=71804 RepID=UPI0004F49FA8|nr:hypothetical protein DQ04_02101050 [Trypanosoma grayi]KEG11971.1 hypothetical protein DQ04_02101050 [Trypanosoma grayi]